ncbi:MAG TPA: hypothetical protein VF175_12225 [Lacipirellula sp.]
MRNRTLIAALLIACVVATAALAQESSQQENAALTSTLTQLIRDAIPLAYDKQKDWGATREITIGYRVDGKPFHYHVHRRKKAVEHGVWKHYRLRHIDPANNLRVRLRDLHAIAPGRMGFTLELESKLDAWARAKVYQYGVHLIALEMEADLRLRVEIRGEVGLQATIVNGAAAMAVQPVVTDAKLALDELNIRRVSEARGPIVRELSDGVRGILEDELNGPHLAAKLNRAIEKKRDRLTFAAGDLIAQGWWPASQ